MMDDHDDFAFEPIPGLPEKLPEGETMLWQGSPDWRKLAIEAFHLRKVAVYVAVVAVWHLASVTGEGATVPALALTAGRLFIVAGIGFAILCGLAYLYAKGTIYTLTTKRIVIRSGVALPVTLNLPLALIDTVALARRGETGGSIALGVSRPNRIAYFALWPNARPLRFNNPQPMLRSLADIETPARLLSRALDVAGGVRQGAIATSPSRLPAGIPAGSRMAYRGEFR